MSEKKKVLLAGESWMSFTTHVKGFDTFYTSVYETGEKFLKAALEEGGYDFTFLPNHLAMEEFPFRCFPISAPTPCCFRERPLPEAR